MIVCIFTSKMNNKINGGFFNHETQPIFLFINLYIFGKKFTLFVAIANKSIVREENWFYENSYPHKSIA